MKVTQPYVLALLKRGEGSKTPITIHPHEVPILEVMYGQGNIEVTDEEPPVKSAEFETEDEYARLESYYRGNGENGNPTATAYRNLSEFEACFQEVGGSNESDKAALVEEAKDLGIKATMNWGVEKLQDAIAKAKAE